MVPRDNDVFPNDGNGDALWRMFSSGDDLSKVREIEFFLIFPAKKLAFDFAVSMLQAGFKVSASEYNETPDYVWQVGVYPILQPSYLTINNFEAMLEKKSKIFQGKNDGWGCFQQS